MRRFLAQLILLLTLVMSLTACKKEDPNPELLDPIYKDLETRHALYTKNYEESKAKLPKLEEAVEKAEPRSIDLKNARRELEKEKLKLMNADQLVRFYRIRKERRKLTARLDYKKAFAADKPWPDPKEFSEYQTNMRLQEVNRNWATRVPKLQDRISKTGKPAAKEKAAESGGGH